MILKKIKKFFLNYIHWINFVFSLIIITFIAFFVASNYHIENNAVFKTVLLHIVTYAFTVSVKHKLDEKKQDKLKKKKLFNFKKRGKKTTPDTERDFE